MQKIMMNKIIPISKKAQKKLWLARYPALGDAGLEENAGSGEGNMRVSYCLLSFVGCATELVWRVGRIVRAWPEHK
jgi:hypothetical protein